MCGLGWGHATEEATSLHPRAESGPCASAGRQSRAPGRAVPRALHRGGCVAGSRCQGGVSEAPGAHGVSAEVFESPLLESEEEHLLLDPGSVLKLCCDANQSGASVLWYKESRPLVPGGRVRLRQSLLEISEVAYEDSGLYVCRARGTGEILRNFTISVVGRSPGSAQLPAGAARQPLPARPCGQGCPAQPVFLCRLAGVG